MITIEKIDHSGGYGMEIRNLITFIHVAETGNFTKAAEQLGYSQSTISFQIKQLEDELGCLLFDRINHTITLTDRGHELISYAHRILTLNDEFKDNLKQEKECTGHGKHPQCTRIEKEGNKGFSSRAQGEICGICDGVHPHNAGKNAYEVNRKLLCSLVRFGIKRGNK